MAVAVTEGDSTAGRPHYSVLNRLYDRIYAFKDYAGESGRLRDLIRERAPAARTLLDVACGTGMHLQHLRAWFEVEGVDLDPELLAIAGERLPGVPLTVGDMTTLELGRRFDAVTCLFSAVGYVVTEERLRATAAALARHLEPGGLLVVEPWLTPEAWRDGHVGAVFVDDEELKLARINSARREGRVSVLELHYLVGTPAAVERFEETHRLGLFSEDEYRGAFEAAGLQVEHDPEGLTGRGLWIARRA